MTRDEMIQKATTMLNERHAHAARLGVEQIVDILAEIGVVKVEEPPRCVPPEGTTDLFHWLVYVGDAPNLRGTSQVAKWEQGAWRMVGKMNLIYPEIVHQLGWIYGRAAK